MIFEVFRFEGENKFTPSKELNVGIFQDEANICIYLFDKELARVVGRLLAENEYNFSEIFKVLAKQLGASIEIEEDKDSIKIEFEYRDVKGASSRL